MARRKDMMNELRQDLEEFGIGEIKRYKKEFPYELDYNIVQYGNLLIYYNQVYDFYNKYEYETGGWSNDYIWHKYKLDTRRCIDDLLKEEQ